jgi:hypothetical protein
MKRDLVLWMGPVAPWQVPGATLYPDPEEPIVKHIGCLGDRDPNCLDIVYQLTDADGRRMPRLFERMKVDPSEVRDFVIGAFSAGGTLAKYLVEHPEDRAMVRALMLSDATYTRWETPGVAAPIEGFVRYGVDAAQGDQLFVATASTSPNFTYPNGVQGLMATMGEIEQRTGQSFAPSSALATVDPPPVEAYELGSVLCGDYQMVIGHNHPSIADQVWQQILWPWLEQRRAAGPEPIEPVDPVEPGPAPGTKPGKPPTVAVPANNLSLQLLSIAIGAGAGYLGAKLWRG